MTATLASEEVFIVDDDPMVSGRLSEAFSRACFRCTTFVESASFIVASRARIPACVILDVYLRGRSGLEILKELDPGNYPAPIFIMSGRGDIPTAVEAIKLGAIDFVEKRLGADTLVKRAHDVIKARSQLREKRDGSKDPSFVFAGCDRLTPREREVLALIAVAATNREAATNLGISHRTVEVHRTHIMRKLGAKNSIDLALKVMGRKFRA